MSEPTTVTEPTTPATPVAAEPTKPVSAAVVQPVPDALKPAPATTPEPKPAGAVSDKGGDEGKTQAEKKPGTDAAPTPNAGAPEKYEFKAPEGMELDQSAIEKFVPVAKALNLNQESAQKLVELQAEMKKAEAEAQQKIINGWKEETIKELGTNAEQQLASVAKVRERLFDKEFNDLLEQTGLGNHPAAVRTGIRLGKMISEDSVPSGATHGSGDVPASVMYPSATK